MNSNQIQGLVKTTSVVLGLGLITSISTSVQAETLTGLTAFGSSQYIYTIDSSAPGTLIGQNAVIGVTPGESLMDIGYIGNSLYAVGNYADLYTINTTTGLANMVGNFGTINGFFAGADFTAAGIRITTSANANLLVSPTTGNLIALGPDITPSILALTALSSSGGTTYAIDSAAGTLNTLNPVTGTVTSIGSLGILDSIRNGFDISPSSGTAYFASSVGNPGSDPNLYTIDLATGAATLVGEIGPGIGIPNLGLTVNPVPVPEPGSLALLVSGLGGFGMLVLTKRRRN